MMPLILLLVYFSNFTINYLDGEGSPHYIWNKKAANQKQEKHYDVIVLGDSDTNAAYVPELLSDGTINLALAGLTPLQNFYTLQEWLEHNEPPKVCYISFNDEHLRYFDGFWERGLFFHRYSLKENVAMLCSAREVGNPHIWDGHTIWDLISYEAWLPNKYMTAFMNAGANQRRAWNITNTALTELHRGRYVGRTVAKYSQAEDITVNVFSVEPPFSNYYKKMIDLCIENGIQVRLIRLPLPDNYVFTEEYYEAFYAYYAALQAEYPEVTIDFFPLYEKDDFMDMHHMNSYGGLRFSTELKMLYPEDFGDEPLNADQIAGINDYIAQEVELDHVFDWAAGRGYTVLLCDAQGVVPALYGEQIDTALSDVPLIITLLAPGRAPEGYSIYAATDGEMADVTVARAEDGMLMVQVAGGEPIPWTVMPGANLSVFVIDAFGRTVCAKSFDFTEGPELTFLG